MARVILEPLTYEYDKINPITGEIIGDSVGVYMGTNHNMIFNNENYIVPKPRVNNNKHKDRPEVVEAQDEYFAMHAPMPVNINAVVDDPVPIPAAVPVPIVQIECNSEDQFWNIINMIGWRYSGEGRPQNIDVLGTLNASGKNNFRRMYEGFIEMIRPAVSGIVRNRTDIIPVSSHFIGLGRDTFYGLLEDSTFIAIITDENMWSNFDNEVLSRL